ncbi:MAG: hypothetical protein M4579_003232 [Chaenotheca gracillima]|nr:MAG: hypothetical protein M4579_003232 [Chaenotheca gracillima]
MVQLSYVLSSLALLSVATAAPSAEARHNHNGGPKAVYFMTNEAGGNNVVALKVGRDGKLSDGSITSTRGKGASAINAANSAPAGPDSTFSQDPLKVVGDMLAVVNPGSNTLSLFSIDSRDATRLRLIGRPVDTMGDFPVSVAVSETLKTACVANSGAKSGIACFSMSSRRGLRPLDKKLRSIPLNQSTPPSGPPSTISDTFFSSDSSYLFATVKGDGANNTSNPGFLSVFPVKDGKVSRKETRSSPPGTTTLFGSVPLPNSRRDDGSSGIFISDPGFGGLTVSVSKEHRRGDPSVSTLATSRVDGQKASCWSTYSDKTGTAFLGDAGLNRLVEIDTASGAIVSETSPSNGNPGMLDLVAGGNYLYGLSAGAPGGAAIAVFDVGGGKGKVRAIQNFRPKKFSGVSASGLTLKT